MLMDVGDRLGRIGCAGMLRMARLGADLVALLVGLVVFLKAFFRLGDVIRPGAFAGIR
jgi:hypothetical protein